MHAFAPLLESFLPQQGWLVLKFSFKSHFLRAIFSEGRSEFVVPLVWWFERAVSPVGSDI